MAIAKMSPGIVRFYFDSKAAMLVASLTFLAAEFDERVLQPVAALKRQPVAALERLVDLYLDPEIASPRKVSVWYAFWGEASSRQEYYDICGRKDEGFAALVRELIERLIDETARTHLDPDGVALGLIGALEILWQEFAFRSEPDIDRAGAKQRCLAYLRSVFPAEFALPRLASDAPRIEGPACDATKLLALERDRVLRRTWLLLGHASQVRRPGDYFTVDTGAERAFVVRDAGGRLHALRNCCPASPHAMVRNRSGRIAAIECETHHLGFGLDGRRIDPGGTSLGRNLDLTALDVCSVGGLLFARSPGLEDGRMAAPDPRGWFEPVPAAGLAATGPPLEIAVAADWKVVVEQWLGAAAASAAGVHDDLLVWSGVVAEVGWSARRYRALLACVEPLSWRNRLVAPNQLLEERPDGLSVIQAVPTAPGCSLVRRFDFTLLPPDDAARAVVFLVRRLSPFARSATLQLAESVQEGMSGFGYGPATASAAVACFRRQVESLRLS